MKLVKPNLTHKPTVKRRPVKFLNDNLHSSTDHYNTTNSRTTTIWFILITTLLLLHAVNPYVAADPQLPEGVLPLIASVISTPGVGDSGLGASLIVAQIFNN